MSYKHKFLVAKPELTDPVFEKSIILILEDSPTGASGFIVNGKEVGRVGYGDMRDIGSLPKSKDDIINLVESGKVDSVTMTTGGPVGEGIFMIHAYDELCDDDSNQKPDDGDFIQVKNYTPKATIRPGLYFGSPATMARIAVDKDKLAARKFRLFCGTASWGPDQLQREIDGGAWAVRDFDIDVIFDEEAARRLVADVHGDEPAETPRPTGYFSYYTQESEN